MNSHDDHPVELLQSKQNSVEHISISDESLVLPVDQELCDENFGGVTLNNAALDVQTDAPVALAGSFCESNVDEMGMVSGHFVADAATLRQLIASGAVQLTDINGQPIHVSPGDSSQVIQLLGDVGSSSGIDERPILTDVKVDTKEEKTFPVPVSYTLPALPTSVPPGTPSWAARLRDLEKIGDYYRGWVENDIELDLLLTYHKQQTSSTWGTRQSPCNNKQTTRLMWKSQYVPFDGIPFLNAGSRAIVMECQHGPRRRGNQSKKNASYPFPDFKMACPARIYVKKVKKFIEYGVDIAQDKRALKDDMEQAFTALHKKELKAYAQERYYVQLPTVKAHENHTVTEAGVKNATKPGITTSIAPADTPVVKNAEILSSSGHVVNATIVSSGPPQCSRLHPLVLEKIRELVSEGENRLYAIRKHLRKYVEKEMFEAQDNVPERHNLTYFPTVHDLKNHIHQALIDIDKGLLQVNSNQVTYEIQPQVKLDWGEDKVSARAVVLFLVQARDKPGHEVSRVELELSDGTTRMNDSLNLETARIMERLQPSMFPLNKLMEQVTLPPGLQSSVRFDVCPDSEEAIQLLHSMHSNSPSVTCGQKNFDQMLSTRNIHVASCITPASITTVKEVTASGDASMNIMLPVQEQSARIIAASSDQSGYALVQTETGALLLAKGNNIEGYHILGQAGTAFNTPVYMVGAANTDTDTDKDIGGAPVTLEYSGLGSPSTIDSVSLGLSIDGSVGLGQNMIFNTIKQEKESGDHM